MPLEDNIAYLTTVRRDNAPEVTTYYNLPAINEAEEHEYEVVTDVGRKHVPEPDPDEGYENPVN